ncbi:MAG: hypothetical protein BWY91_02817 [bacterium ADurb.BinA028]|nr:MAG: hypothetical protein BWY91_02817 [bacterium ADurb.BinA028]
MLDDLSLGHRVGPPQVVDATHGGRNDLNVSLDVSVNDLCELAVLDLVNSLELNGLDRGSRRRGIPHRPRLSGRRDLGRLLSLRCLGAREDRTHGRTSGRRGGTCRCARP